MLNEQERQLFWQTIHRQWIQPELDKRFGTTGLPSNFKIHECLILLPKDRAPIVQFNKEFGWLVENPKLARGKKLADMDFYQPIYLTEIAVIDNVLPPMIDGERVAFIYLYWSGHGYISFSDFRPLELDYDPIEEKTKFDGRVIADHLMDILFEQVVQVAKNYQSQLREIGLWTAISLLLYPLSEIVEKIEKGDHEEARKLLIHHCNIQFLSDLVATWKPIEAFRNRYESFDDALFCHQNGRYRASISVMVDDVEGVVSDWLYKIKKFSSHSPKEKMEAFRDALSEVPGLLWLHKEALASATTFLISGAWLQHFDGSMQTEIDTSFPGRHPVQHGVFANDIYTEENSVKMFLLLDTICQSMMFYEVRVLGGNLSQGDAE